MMLISQYTIKALLPRLLVAPIFSITLAWGGTEPPVSNNANKALALEVVDSYLEMHTGPGRGYPVFFVIEQGEAVEVLTRRPDWYEVRIKKGGEYKLGWVKAPQIARTMKASGEPADLPSTSYGDYAKNRWRFGFVAGSLSGRELKNADTFGASLGYNPLSWLGAELELSKFYGNDVRGTQLNLNAVLEPFSQWRLSPSVILGGGTTDVEAQPRLVPLAFDNESHQTYGLRLNYYAGRNFIVRGEYRQLNISTSSGSEEFDVWNLGFSTLF